MYSYEGNIVAQKNTSLQQNKKHNVVIHQNDNELSISVPGNNLQSVNKVIIDPDMRLQMIAMSAYFRAEKHGSFPGSELEDWLASEQEVDRHLSSFSS
jgi:hypothetical protein